MAFAYRQLLAKPEALGEARSLSLGLSEADEGYGKWKVRCDERGADHANSDF